MKNNHEEMMVLIPAWLARAAEAEGRRGPRRCSADQVLSDWIWIGRDAERQAVRAKGLRQLGDRVAGLADGRKRAVLVSGDLAAAVAASKQAVGGQLAVWAVLGAIVEAAVGARRRRREIGGRRDRVRILSTRSNGSLAWHARCLMGVQRMAVDEEYRKEIAKRLS